jgi:DNA-directed RNA polymerase subunit N (RpoN/RPB10)
VGIEYAAWEQYTLFMGTPCTSCGNRIGAYWEHHAPRVGIEYAAWEQQTLFLGMTCNSYGNIM